MTSRPFQIIYKINNQTVCSQPIKFQPPAIKIQTVNVEDEINCQEVSLNDCDEQFEPVHDENHQKMFEVGPQETTKSAIFQSTNVRSSEVQNKPKATTQFIIIHPPQRIKIPSSNHIPKAPVTYEISSDSDDDVIEVKSSIEVIKSDMPKSEKASKVPSETLKVKTLELPQNTSIKEEPELEINDTNVINDLEIESEPELQIDSDLELVLDEEEESENVVIKEEEVEGIAPSKLDPSTALYIDPQIDVTPFLDNTPNLTFNCLHCDRTFDNKFNYITHQSVHLSLNYQCNVCLKKFRLLNNLNAHVCIRCDECGELFRNESLKSVHMREYHRIKVKKNFFECDQCGKKFKQRQRLKYHMHDFHMRVEATLKCDLCDMKIKCKKYLRKHLKTHEEPIKCEFCSEKVVPFRMRYHLVQAHADVKGFCEMDEDQKKLVKKLNCNICGLKFKAKKILHEHLQWHENPQVFRCNVCGKNFLLKSFLELHRIGHDNFSCPRSFCNYTTNAQFKLDKHMIGHAKRDKFLEEKKNWIRCEYCPVFIKNKLKLSSHVWKNHPEKMM